MSHGTDFHGDQDPDGLRARLSELANENIRTVLLGPTLVSLLLVFIYPVLVLIWSSLHKTRGISSSFAPLYNYQRMFTDPSFWYSFERTLIFSFGSLTLTMLAGLAIALALDKVIKQRVRDVYTTLLLLSWAVPLSIVGVMWKWMFNGELGIVNRILIDLGLLAAPYSWLGNGPTAMAIIILADAWARIPFATVVLLAGLQSIPREMYDATRVDGATTLQRFRHVTLPYLRPSFFVAGLITWMFSFRAFAIPFATTSGGPAGATEVLAIYIHRYGISLFDFGYASTVSLFLVAVTLVVAAFYVTTILENISEVE